MSLEPSKVKAATKTASKAATKSGGRTSLRLMQVSMAAGVAFAVVVTVFVNMFAARHYERWDLTESDLFTLSPVTEQTLQQLTDPIEIYVLLSSADPMQLSVRHMLDAYGGETPQLQVTFVDPDRNPAEFLRVQQRFGIEVGKTEGGQVVTDAHIIVVRGDRRHFLTADDLMSIEEGEELRARPRIEEALTGAIAGVTKGTPPRVCVTTGHGEPSLDEGGRGGLLGFKLRMFKLNYEVVALEPVQTLTGRDPIADCKAVILAGPGQPLSDAEVTRLSSYIQSGGSAMLAVSPLPDAAHSGYRDLRVRPLYALAGVVPRNDFIFELDPGKRSAQGGGERFFPDIEAHPITLGFLDADVPILIGLANSLTVAEGAPTPPDALLKTGAVSFGMREFWTWDSSQAPRPRKGDEKGPLVVAYAAELPKHNPDASHGPRIVALGTMTPILSDSWADPHMRGAGLFVESSISWLVDEPLALDLPRKAAKPVGHEIREDLLSSVFWKVLVFVPCAVMLLGIGVGLLRRAGEKRSRERSQADDDTRRSDEDDDDRPAKKGRADDAGAHDAGADDEGADDAGAEDQGADDGRGEA